MLINNVKIRDCPYFYMEQVSYRKMVLLASRVKNLIYKEIDEWLHTAGINFIKRMIA